MRNLDDLKIIENVDKANMREILVNFDQQYRHARELAEAFELPEHYGQAKNIVTSGMGGSAIGGDLLRSLFVSEWYKFLSPF